MFFQRKTHHTLLSLALQGGGAHGAFTWGVLDALLADESIAFDGLCGTSAGAMNAICLAQGWLEDGRSGAQAALRRFWQAVAAQSPFPANSATPAGEAPRLSAAMRLMMQWSQHLSPAQLNPFDLNPLRDILAEQIDFSALRRHAPLKLFIAATHANSGKLKIFRNADLSLEVLLASACLPTLHRSILIDGEAYWDGGYSANPAIFPLLEECAAADILLVLLAPLKYSSMPQSALDIRQRLQELAFNNTFLREMRTFAHLRARSQGDWLAQGRSERRLRQARFHAISAEQHLGDLPMESKLTVEPAYFAALHDQGEVHAQNWLVAHRADLGQRESLDLNALFY
jgi:NTE family protein